MPLRTANFRNSFIIGGTHGYIISRKCAIRFMKDIAKNGMKRPIDAWICSTEERLIIIGNVFLTLFLLIGSIMQILLSIVIFKRDVSSAKFDRLYIYIINI